MEIVKLETGTTFKCNCSGCNGTGVYKGSNEKGQVAVVCFNCNGRGYEEVTVDQFHLYYKDVQTGVILKRIDDSFIPVEFKRRIKRDDVKYVVYESYLTADEEYYFEHGYTYSQVLPYRLFLAGFLPMPIQNRNCPARLEQCYNHKHTYNNECKCDEYHNCPKFKDKDELKGCWKGFYKTLNPKKRHDILKRMGTNNDNE